MRNLLNYERMFYVFLILGALNLWAHKPFGWFMVSLALVLHIYGEYIHALSIKVLVRKFEKDQLEIMINNTQVMEKELLDLYHKQIESKD
jgi:hypothetical protein